MTWELYLVRTFSLLGASLWQKWYTSDEFEKIWGFRFGDVILIEEREDVVRHYRKKDELKLYDDSTITLIREQKKLHKLLLKAEKLNEQAKKYIAGEKKFEELDSAITFHITLALNAAALPRYIFAFEEETIRPDTAKIAERLRALSYFPKFYRRVLLPMLEQVMRKAGHNPKHIQFLTIDEIKAGQFDRALERKRPQQYIYECQGDEEFVEYVDDPNYRIRELEPEIGKTTSVKGRTAYPGKVSGTVRVVNTLDLSNVTFNEGDILVTISSSPMLMPIISKACAIVSDEGGIGSHANIISRELKIPCVIGTKHASLVFKDGDMVEVDADKGIVRKI